MPPSGKSAQGKAAPCQCHRRGWMGLRNTLRRTTKTHRGWEAAATALGTTLSRGKGADKRGRSAGPGTGHPNAAPLLLGARRWAEPRPHGLAPREPGGSDGAEGTGLYLASLDIYSICANRARWQPGLGAAPALPRSLLGNRYHAAVPESARNNRAKTEPTRKSSS